MLERPVCISKLEYEAGEKREFLPDLVYELVKNQGWTVLVDEGYGIKIGYDTSLYLNSGARLKDTPDFPNNPIVLTLRYPTDDFVKNLPPGTLMFSMFHFPTRPDRVTLLNQLQIQAIALDQIKDDEGKRLVENLRSVAWNGVYAGFKAIELNKPGINPIRTLTIGSGNIGKYSVDAAVHYGNTNPKHKPGVIASAVGKNVTNDKQLLRHLLKQTDILIDATERHHPEYPIIENADIELLPQHSIIVDLCVDPYKVEGGKIISTKAIEGIPQGNLDQFIIQPNDQQWNDVPDEIVKNHRRTVVSCYSWPGVFPEQSMKTYGKQLLPLFEVLRDKTYEELSMEGNYYERALLRGTLKYHLESSL